MREPANVRLNIKNLAIRRGITIKKVMELCKFSSQYLYNIEDSPLFIPIVTVAELMNVSIESLVFDAFYLGEAPKPHQYKGCRRIPIAEQINAISRANKISLFDLETEIGISYQYVYRAKDSGRSPQLYSAIAIADYAGISLDELVYVPFQRIARNDV